MIRPCDLCGATDSLDTPGDPSGKIRICKGCGFVHVKERRSIAEVANAWEKIYADGGYDPNWPGVKARLFYVREWLDQNVGLEGKSVLDIGAGSGLFMGFVRDRGAHPVGVDPSSDNCRRIRAQDMACFRGFASDNAPNIGQYDIVTLNWTLENVGDCLAVLRYAKRCLAPGGHVVVATGSRILTPFKKPLSSYLPQDKDYPHDTHCYRWSKASLQAALALAGLCHAVSNDADVRDELVIAAVEGPMVQPRDIAIAVENFFSIWAEQFS